MTERISMVLPELSPDVKQSNKERKNAWFKSGFDHIGSTKNGSYTREWNLHDFRDQIQYLKSNDDVIFYLRTILQDHEMRDIFTEKLNVSPDEYWQNTYLREEFPNLTREEYLEKDFWKSLANEGETQNILKKLPDDFLLETLKVYNKEINRIRTESLDTIDKMRQDFIPYFKNFTKKYNVEVNWEEIQHKFDTLSYDLFDQYHEDQCSGEKTGDYEKYSHTARVEISPFSRISFSTLQHEHLHAVSGRKNVFNLAELSFGLLYTEHALPRLGVEFARSRSHPNRFKWLNEAITEHINIDMKKDNLKKDEYFEFENSYPDERKLFELILSRGQKPVAAKLFYQTYFESDAEDPTALKHRKELYQEISEAYGSPRFLIELDDMIKRINIKKATEIFKSSGKEGVHSWWLNKFTNKK